MRCERFASGAIESRLSHPMSDFSDSLLHTAVRGTSPRTPYLQHLGLGNLRQGRGREGHRGAAEAGGGPSGDRRAQAAQDGTFQLHQ